MKKLKTKWKKIRTAFIICSIKTKKGWCGCVFQMCKHENIYSMSSNIRANLSDVSPEKRNISFGSTKNETSLQETNVIFEMEK